jgi:hypothetical protein
MATDIPVRLRPTSALRIRRTTCGASPRDGWWSTRRFGDIINSRGDAIICCSPLEVERSALA